MRGFSSLAAAGLVTAVCAAPAVAADTVSVSRSNTVATFEGKLGAGTHLGFPAVENQLPQCLPQNLDCESTLVRVDDFGAVTYSLTEDELTDEISRIDLTVHESDAEGTQGASVGSSQGYAFNTLTVADADSHPGWFLFVARWHDGASDYTGRVELTPRPLEP